jgi:hypothetical protein
VTRISEASIPDGASLGLRRGGWHLSLGEFKWSSQHHG